MIKKILGLIVAIIVAALAIINVNVNANKKGLTDISLANIEALAQDEGGSGLTGTCHGEDTFCQFNCPGCGQLIGVGGDVRGNPSNLSGTCPYEGCGHVF